MALFHKQKKSSSGGRVLSPRLSAKSPFAIKEAYNSIRTKLIFTGKGEKCPIFAVTSSLAADGKTTNAVNLAISFAIANQRVLLIDADMRLSHVARTLSLRFAPGLSNILVGDNNGEGLVQRSELLENLSVICCGDIPPNPTELLSSQRIGVLLETLKKSYDYIIVDLPPVSAVSDALILSKLTDGMIVVVRQGHADKKLLGDTVRQLQYNGAHIIGFVMNGTREMGRYYRYRRKKYAYGAYIYRQYGDEK